MIALGFSIISLLDLGMILFGPDCAGLFLYFFVLLIINTTLMVRYIRLSVRRRA
jgi:hypothetical protein